MDYGDLALEFLRNMHALQKAGHQRFIQEGIQGEAFVLHHIGRHDEIIPGHISDAMGISSARVAAVLNSLEGKGLITREIDSGDRRRIIVRLTPKGHEHEEAQRNRNIELLKGLLMQLGEDDAKEYVRITGRLAEVLSNIRD
ncbi:MAG: MarR family transcriptional regulator [Methanomassiliicoccaceae archaeon]|jgi:DNA-binding MarR family transcriptional regulator|nr:MarR family transcriptional regulator [Methanomassiliicoccaceae archaeon]